MNMRGADNWFEIKELATGLFGIAEFGHVEEVISFLLVGNKSAILIDSGLGFFSMKQVVEKLTDLPCKVLNTHSHFDHVGSNFEFDEILIFDHPDCRKAAEQGFSSDYLSQWATDQQCWGSRPTGMLDPYTIAPFPNAKFFTNGDVFLDSSFSLEAIHTPGHSDDSVCFVEKNRGWLFAGDLLYDGPIYIERIGGLSKFRNSVEKVAKLSNLNNIYSSHNYFEFQQTKLPLVQNALAKIDTKELEKEIQLGDRLKLVPA